jgi:hypothetical protein
MVVVVVLLGVVEVEEVEEEIGEEGLKGSCGRVVSRRRSSSLKGSRVQQIRPTAHMTHSP